MTERRIVPEFSRAVAADRVGAGRQERRIEANPSEREKLARRFGLLSLDRLDACLELHRDGGDIIRVQGRLVADVVQSCVLSLAPVPAHLEVDFKTSYSVLVQEGREAVLDPLGEDEPEPIPDGEIDLGEAVAQQLAVALDPYPRAPGASLPGEAAPPKAAAATTPFASLQGLGKKP